MEYKEFEFRDHLKEPYYNMVDRFKTDNYTSINLTTGLGKTIIVEKLILDNFDKRFLIVVPKNAIKQDHKKDIEEYCWKKDKDGTIINPPSIEYMCYNSINKIMNTKDAYDFVVLDEYHHVGGDVWEDQVRRLMENNPNCKFLGTTATYVRSDGKNMSDELFGHQSGNIGLGEAIEKELLAPIDIYGVAYKLDEDLEFVQNYVKIGNIKDQDKYNKLIEKIKTQANNANRLSDFFSSVIPEKHGKYIVFCQDISQMKTMIEDCDSWFPGIGVSKYSIYYKYKEEKNNKSIEQFSLEDASDKMVLLFNIDMVGEGLHIEELDGIISFSPTKSIVKYQQQIGRVLTTHWKNYESKIPRIIDITNSIDDLRIFTNTKRLADSLDFRDSNKIGISFHIDKVCSNVMEIIDKINAITEMTGRDFVIGLSYSKAYYKERGNLLVKRDFVSEDGFPLGEWINNRREDYKNNKLSSGKIELLESIGMVWVPKDEKFNTEFSYAKNYYDKNENLCMSDDFICEDGFPLGKWLNDRRIDYINDKLPSYKIKLLESIGMIWISSSFDDFTIGFLHAKEYYRKYGNLYVPDDFICEDGFALGKWISEKRNTYARNGISSVKIKMLESIGMVWSSFMVGFLHAKEYYEKHGNLLVGRTFVCEDGFPLGEWIKTKRRSYKNNRLSSDKIKLLESIGMVWVVKEK